MMVLANERKEKVKWKWKLSIGVEQKVNNDGMIRLLLHNQTVFYLPYELWKKLSAKKWKKKGTFLYKGLVNVY